MEKINELEIHTDCIHFRGDLPCKPHKKHGYHCKDCPAYQKIETRILIVKLGAIGDVIRTTPLLRRIRKEYPNAKITWVTHTPSILPADAVDEILKYDFKSILYIQQVQFDVFFNLDKDKDACALSLTINAKEKFGYTLYNGVPYPMNDLANHKYSTGLFDDISKSNTKSYVQEIFEMVGWQFNGEEYVFENHEQDGYTWNLDKSKKLVGLNTGCGDRWTTRLWADANWIQLIQLLQAKGYEPVLLGGEQEHQKNSELAKQTGALYLGHFSLPQFINLIYQMDIVVTQVTMAMHITVALQKKIVLMNNIFNPHEFELYGRGVIVEPTKVCDCYFDGTCIHGESCMKDISPEVILEEVSKQLD
ncbi:MAG: glycosyltransferase family 9 protein [Crocinitomicaceae bacterium]|nr:glycosyltransferase family 9 protein [Crocinitomicaceae bacterium]